MTLQEIAAATGRKADKVRDECVELDLMVREDWAGRPAVSVNDARALVNGSARRAWEHAVWEAGVKAACREWEAARAAAAEAAGAEVDARHAKSWRKKSPGEALSERREARVHAAAQFERTHKRPGRYVNLQYIDASEEGSRVAAAVGAIRGPAAAESRAKEVA
ncbi:hypothetical protein ACFT9I_06230 [Streptomyces sp. NPDC057137]|uniref:hypothetical protein n=1 Tax=Streptomyces sp. NPDC057137 TaxID=3346030 RepID=UPI0036264B30